MAAFFCPQTEELSRQHWYGISYLRLSKLGKRYESESIDNQRKLIREFVQRRSRQDLCAKLFAGSAE